MKKQDLFELLGFEELFYKALLEVYEITQELDLAIDRQESVSIRMLLSSRELPIMKLYSMKKYILLKRVDLMEEDARRFDQLLTGASADTSDEMTVVRQIADNRRMLKKLSALDKIVNLKLCNDRSFYNRQ